MPNASFNPILSNPDRLRAMLEAQRNGRREPVANYLTDQQRPTSTRLEESQFFEQSPQTLAEKTQVQPPVKPDASPVTKAVPGTSDKKKDDDKKKKKHKSGMQALAAKTPMESKYRALGSYAISVANAGIFLQNLMAFSRSIVMDRNPQAMNLLGSSVNLASCFMPMHLRLPAFVLGTSFYMGGAALATSHDDQVNVAQPPGDKKTFHKIVEGGKWDSKKYFPHPKYVNAKGKGFMHMAHPGALSALARNKFFDVYYPTFKTLKQPFDKATFLPKEVQYFVPSFMANVAGSVSQLGWMTGKVLTDWRFAHDALMPFTRREFLKGTHYTMPNSPAYALALGAVLPVSMMGAALAVDGVKHAMKKKKEDQADKNAPNPAISPEKTTPKSSKAEDPFAKQHSSSLELVANASSIIPQLANLMFLSFVRKEASGKPIRFMAKGLSLHHKITPRLNAALIANSIGSLVAASAATVSDMALLPRYVAYISDILFMAFSGATNVGLMRNVFEMQYENPMTAHFFPAKPQEQFMKDVVQAEVRGWNRWWPPKHRFPVTPDTDGLRKIARGNN